MHYQLPPPDNYEVFESLMLDLFNEIESTSTYQKYGVQGQKQNGIDIISNEQKTVIQCKKRQYDLMHLYEGGRQEGDIKKMKRAFSQDFKKTLESGVEFGRFIFATTYRDQTDLINLAMQLSNEHGKDIRYWGWETIMPYIIDSEKLINKYYQKFKISQNVKIAYIRCSKEELRWEQKDTDDSSNLQFYFSSDFEKPDSEEAALTIEICFLNNTDLPVVLNKLSGYLNFAWSPARGGRYVPGKIKPIESYKLKLKGRGIETGLQLHPAIYLPAKKAVSINLSVLGETFHHSVHYILNLKFFFDGKTLFAPPMYLNCSKDDYAFGKYEY